MNNYPAGVTGHEVAIAGADEFEFSCPTCSEDLTFVGDKWQAEADCPECGTVWVCPDELLEDMEDQRRADAWEDAQRGY